MKCPKCHKEVEKGSLYCPYCLAEIPWVKEFDSGRNTYEERTAESSATEEIQV